MCSLAYTTCNTSVQQPQWVWLLWSLYSHLLYICSVSCTVISVMFFYHFCVKTVLLHRDLQVTCASFTFVSWGVVLLRSHAESQLLELWVLNFRLRGLGLRYKYLYAYFLWNKRRCFPYLVCGQCSPGQWQQHYVLLVTLVQLKVSLNIQGIGQW